MKTSAFASLALVALLALPGVAAAQPGYGYGYGCDGPMGMTDEQVANVRQLHRTHWEKTQPLMQERFAKLAELDHLYAAGAKDDDAKVQAALKDLRNIDGKLYAAEADMLRQMGEKGVPYRGRHGMRGGWGGCPGEGYGRGGYGPCYGQGRGGYGRGMGRGGYGYGHGMGGCGGCM
ncbi:MAG: hypothetical protein IJU65_00905 [Desulfovibrio sp.]|nr:hypothetical protein [Desulfovibrio sp.]